MPVCEYCEYKNQCSYKNQGQSACPFKNQETDSQLDVKDIKSMKKELSKFHDDLSVCFDPQNGVFKIRVNLQNCNDPDAVIYDKYWSLLVSYDRPIDYKEDFHLQLYRIDKDRRGVNPKELDELKQNLLAKRDEYYKFLRLAEKIKSMLSDFGFNSEYQICSESSIYYRIEYKYTYWTLRVSDHRPKPENKKRNLELYYYYFQKNYDIKPNELDKFNKELTAIKNEYADE